MGNFSAKPVDNNSISRSPHRNRNISNAQIQRKMFTREGSRRQSGGNSRNSKDQLLRRAMNLKQKTQQKSAECHSETDSYVETTQISSKNSIENGDKNVKRRQRRRVRKRDLKHEEGKSNENSLKNGVSSKVEGGGREKGAGLLSSLFSTVSKLESTFVDEKKYDRRLKSEFSKQIEHMQHLELSLHIEREKNRRLMQLLNRYDSTETANTFNDDNMSRNQSNISQTYGVDRSKWSYTHRFAGVASQHRSVSPLALEHRYDDLQKSYEKCQADLKQKDILLTMAQCKHEELQAKCERLVDEIAASQRKVQSLERKNIYFHKKILLLKRKHMGDFLDSDENSAAAVDNVSESGSKSKENGYRMDSFMRSSTTRDIYFSKLTDMFETLKDEDVLSKNLAE